MAIVKAILKTPPLILSSYTERITNAEYLSAYKRLYASPNYRPGTSEISDLRFVESIEVDLACFEEVIAWAANDPASNVSEMKTAVIVGKAINEGAVRLYSAVSERYGNETLASFQRLEDALEWLGMDTTFAEPLEKKLSSLRATGGGYSE